MRVLTFSDALNFGRPEDQAQAARIGTGIIIGVALGGIGGEEAIATQLERLSKTASAFKGKFAKILG